jgi:predicted protein tyrosine phosphatase
MVCAQSTSQCRVHIVPLHTPKTFVGRAFHTKIVKFAARPLGAVVANSVTLTRALAGVVITVSSTAAVVRTLAFRTAFVNAVFAFGQKMGRFTRITVYAGISCVTKASSGPAITITVSLGSTIVSSVVVCHHAGTILPRVHTFEPAGVRRRQRISRIHWDAAWVCRVAVNAHETFGIGRKDRPRDVVVFHLLVRPR